eukprot:9283285-Karenia_brevis.AAC.1
MVGSKRKVVRPARGKPLQDDLLYSSSDEEPLPEDASQSDAEVLEPWQDWIVRVTHLAEDALKKCNLDDWVAAQKRKKWRWAGHVAH